EEGANVRERQSIVKLPDLNFMKVDARIHESKISRIDIGQPVEIEVDALPGVIYNGVLDSVSSVPVPGSWPNTDLKEYESVIRITDDVEKVRELRPGMNAELRIIVQQRAEDALQVPVQGVMSMMGKHFTYVLTPDGGERRELVIGDSNDEFMEVKDGVKVGEKVIMNPRTHFADEIAELEDRLVQEAEADNKKKPVKAVKKSAKGTGRGKGKSAAGKQGGGPAAGGGRPGGGSFDPASIFTRMDKNGDGKITSDEDTSGRMMASDKDGDGSVSKEEFMEAMKRFMK
ncbi:MAG: HlyD family efflux transporter periplasmic adaptor subunit, partial [Planctomycetaceae bacterium]